MKRAGISLALVVMLLLGAAAPVALSPQGEAMEHDEAPGTAPGASSWGAFWGKPIPLPRQTTGTPQRPRSGRSACPPPAPQR